MRAASNKQVKLTVRELQKLESSRKYGKTRVLVSKASFLFSTAE